MYLVLARKYRPQKLAEVIGQEHVTRTLGNAFATNRVHHAFLFCGPRGCGKTTLARIVGKALNCTNLIPGSAEPCGECSACKSINDGSAVDYIEMDGASNRGIDAIRELTEAVRYQPAVLRKKVYVIDEVHMLTTEAFNALLKTLEEPPPHVTFVLATTEPHKLPNTILSRCQRYDFKLVPAQRLAQHLSTIFVRESIQIEPAAVSLVVRESGGSVRDALSLCDQIISFVGAEAITEAHVAEVLGVADRSLTRSLVRALAEGDAGAALGAVESAIERGVDEVQLARAIVRYLRDLSVLQVAPDRRELVDASDEERADLAAEASQLARNRVTQMFDRMLRCCDELGKTLQPRLVLDCALIDVATIEPLIPLGDLIERLGELEARVAGRGTHTTRGPTAGPGPSKTDLRMTAPGHPAGASRSPAASPARSTAPGTGVGEAATARAATPTAPAKPSGMRGTAPGTGVANKAAPRTDGDGPSASGSAGTSANGSPAGSSTGGSTAGGSTVGGTTVGGTTVGGTSADRGASSGEKLAGSAATTGSHDSQASAAAGARADLRETMPGTGANTAALRDTMRGTTTNASSGSAASGSSSGVSSSSTSSTPSSLASVTAATAGSNSPSSTAGSNSPSSTAGSNSPSSAVGSNSPSSTAGSNSRSSSSATPATASLRGTVPGTGVSNGAPNRSSSTTSSGPVSMQPSGPVPAPSATASGSGPTDPVPAPAPANKSPSDDGLAAWNRVLGELETRRRFSLLGPYQHARVMKWTDEDIELGFPVDLHSMGEMAGDTTSVEEMRTLIRELFGKPTVRLKVRLLDQNESSTGPARSVLETTQETKRVERGKREAEAREHPITKHVLQTFGAQIKEIKTDV